MNVLVVYSSRTGNTRKVAEAVFSVMPPGSVMADIESAPDPKDYDLVVLGFWIDKGTADAKTLEYMKGLKGKKLGLFMTLGADPGSDHAKASMKSVRDELAKENEILREFICQGKVDPALTKMFEQFPAGHPHVMTTERRARHVEASRHPDDADLAAAASCFAETTGELLAGEKP